MMMDLPVRLFFSIALLTKVFVILHFITIENYVKCFPFVWAKPFCANAFQPQVSL